MANLCNKSNNSYHKRLADTLPDYGYKDSTTTVE